MRQPTFLLKPSAYKTNKLYAILPDDGTGDMSVSGYVGNGTRVNADGLIETVPTDTPRIDHFGSCGLLLEDTRTNQATYSEDVSNWLPVSVPTITANDTTSPDGTKTADLVLDNSTSTEYPRNDVTVLDATAIHAISVFVKFKSASTIRMFVSSDGGVQGSIDLDREGNVSLFLNPLDYVTSYGVESYKDGWFRMWLIHDMDDLDTVLNIGVQPQGSGEYGSCWVWGLQV